MKPDALFRLSVEPPAEWVARLNRLFPPHGRAAWYVAAWVPGLPEDPVQRYVVYQAVPACALRDDAIEEIGWADAEVLPPGLKLNRAQTVLGTQVGLNFVAYGDLPSERLRVMRYWSEHRAVLHPAWVVQGPNGGHPYDYTQTEQRLLRAAGHDGKAPLIGELPYALLDERVLWRLTDIDALRRTATRAQLDEAQEREFRRQYLANLTASTDDVFAEMAGLVRHMDLPTYDGAVSRDYDDAEARFLEHGTLT